MSTLHLICHTHWDREWYLTFQQFRLKLVHLVDSLLKILEDDPDYTYFLLDGQAIILEDYLQMRPEREAELSQLIKSSRILIGPWYISPDEFLLSPESHVRNLLEGRRLCNQFGPGMPVGYLPDTFGHIGQMPQILAGFGIESACLWRGLADQPLELYWQAPDGTKALLAFLRESYGNAANLRTDQPDEFISGVEELSRILTPFSSTGQVLLMHGTDHMEPTQHLTAAIQAYQSKSLPDELRQSSLPLFFKAVRSVIAANGINLPVVSGELRSSKSAPLLPNVLSTRIWLKQRNFACEIELIKWVEPLNAWIGQIERSKPGPGTAPANQSQPDLAGQKSILRYAWKMLMQCHPHDSICGTSLDQVHREMMVRFDQVDQISHELANQNLARICDHINTQYSPLDGNSLQDHDILSSIIVFNPNDQPQSGIVNVNIKFEDQYSSFEIIDEQNYSQPFRHDGYGPQELLSMTMDKKGMKQALGMIHEGTVAGMIINHAVIQPDGKKAFIRVTLSDHGTADMSEWKLVQSQLDQVLANESIDEFIIRAFSDPATDLSFIARDVPGHGYRCYWIRGCTKPSVGSSTPRKLSRAAQSILPIFTLISNTPLLRRLASRKNRLPDRRLPRIENEFFVVEVTGSDGSLAITDKRTHRIYEGLNHFIDGSDCGDLYNYCPAPHDQLIHSRLTSIEHVDSEISCTLVIHAEMNIPRSISADRKSRSRERVRQKFTSTVTLVPGVPRVDIHVEIDNQAKDHRLRAHFPAPFACATSFQDGHYELVERPVGLPAYDASWVESPRPEVPQREFSLVTDGQLSLAIANRGLPEVEALINADGNVELAITLLRCVGWLSRDDLQTRKGHAGPMAIATPEAQMIGLSKYDYAIIPGDGQLQPSIHQAYAFNSPLKAITTSIHSGLLRSAFSIVQNPNPDFVITAIKASEAGSDLVIRGYNRLSSAIKVTLTPFRPFNKAWLANLAEELIEALPTGQQGQIDLLVMGNKILTICFCD